MSATTLRWSTTEPKKKRQKGVNLRKHVKLNRPAYDVAFDRKMDSEESVKGLFTLRKRQEILRNKAVSLTRMPPSIIQYSSHRLIGNMKSNNYLRRSKIISEVFCNEGDRGTSLSNRKIQNAIGMPIYVHQHWILLLSHTLIRETWIRNGEEKATNFMGNNKQESFLTIPYQKYT